MMDYRRQLTGAGLVLVAALAWSTAGLFTRVVSTDIPTTLFWRSLTGGLSVLLIYAWLTGVKDLRSLFTFTSGDAVIALLSCLGMICFISAFFYTTIANVSFLYGTMPLVTLVFSVLFLRERPTLLALCCCLACAVGVATMIWGEQNFQHWAGALLAFGMTVFMAAVTVAAKYVPQANMVKAAYLSAFMSAVAVLPFASFAGTSSSDYLWLTLYGFVNVGLGFGVYLLGVLRISAIAAALIGLTEIPLAPIWALILFKETLLPQTVIGGAIILTAGVVYLISKHAKPASEGTTVSARRLRKVEKKAGLSHQ
jgi:drug/metabolite transporter (DMT)-like permease